jgi:sRNA-binding protein
MISKFDLEQYIKMLAGKHPACFFENPRQRQPLKKGIIDDLRAQQRPWDE